MKKILLSALAIVAMTGCTQVQPVNEELPDKPIVVNTNVVSSKAIVVDVTAVALQYVRDDNATPTWDGALTTANRGVDGSISFSKTEYYLKNNSNSYFKFFSDGGTVGTDANKTKITWSVDGKTDLIYNSAGWDLGTYTSPNTSSFVLEHMLTRIEVVLQGSGTESLEAVKASWGDITGIKIAGLSNEITYDYATPGITFGTTVDTQIAMFAGNGYENGFAKATIGANANTDVVAGIMLPAGTNVKNVKLYITATGVTDQEVPVTFVDAISAGKINTITLTFSAKDKAVTVTSTVKAWETGTTGSGSL